MPRLLRPDHFACVDGRPVDFNRDCLRPSKFGIFLHWSLSTIPAYAPSEKGDFH